VRGAQTFDIQLSRLLKVNVEQYECESMLQNMDLPLPFCITTP